MESLSALLIIIALLVATGLLLKSLPILEQQSIKDLLTSSEWKPLKGQFGFFPFFMGTLWVTGIAIALSLPGCLLASIYLTEYASSRTRGLINPLIDLLAGIPPVVYGVWGILVIVPIVGDKLAPYFGDFSSGYSLLTGGIVLSIMIAPLLISIFSEVFYSVPQDLRNASFSLGATQWQTVKKVVVRKSLPGILAAVVLAISRAFGETIAVMMVCGNTVIIPHSIFDAGYPLPALIANNYGEMMSVPLYDSALMFAAFILFLVIFLFNALSRWVIAKLENRIV
ncbi:MAG: phosphate ABC transporter permease subunit PstC [Bacteroidetes bacterium]|nr:phosphate ABC transporter permease subunit PstC [Bacteroidota bacterium]